MLPSLSALENDYFLVLLKTVVVYNTLVGRIPQMRSSVED